MSGQTMTREEVDLFRFEIVLAEVRAGLRCPTCLNRSCSVEYGDFECRGPLPTLPQERKDE
jgi:hypothetical protein